ncbi:alkaline phosphatase D family protein [Paucihalobacter sp.]|uniref:alkaline phosphatase D family protein n=1 Tax=Paucihalobacter sp. TaxID=2850405 RepID=UPI002FE0C6EE
MKHFIQLSFLLLFLLLGCKSPSNFDNSQSDFVIAFGSCNNQKLENNLWPAVLINNPNVWVWGGDNIYSDTYDMEKMAMDYKTLKEHKDYVNVVNSAVILGTWDDHDYGLNDGGEDYEMRKESQRLFLDFFDVPKEDPRRAREGIYHAELFETVNGSVKVIVLDTRYFRTALTKSETKNRRYQPNPYGEGTVLGEEQWKWLEYELKNSEANFNVIVTSIQLLSGEHGFETWANFPHEQDKLYYLIKSSKAKGIMVLSGDRHISEFSKKEIKGLKYPLIDFTSSGLTHVYSSYSGEPNQYRIGNVINQKSFGVLRFNFKAKRVIMSMHDESNKPLAAYVAKY